MAETQQILRFPQDDPARVAGLTTEDAENTEEFALESCFSIFLIVILILKDLAEMVEL